MSQNSVRQYRSFEDLDIQLRRIMKDIHDSAMRAAYALHGEDAPSVDYMTGANIVGFSRVADALVAYGILN